MATALKILHKLLVSFDSHINVNGRPFPLYGTIYEYPASFLQSYKSKIVTNEIK
jgi:hypothetical protein